ncbi:glycosyltransferase family 39 protein [Hyella patelloides]|uniref:glycosyltransferase family 39 protein n=1 Tax=Hyella patelloides TaxID=1982969 RepID=UPI00119E61FF|nr:glycosyltransferase family 39 protein [Hyella patelloides]
MIEQKKWRSHLALLLIWVILGTILRFTNLTAKPPWADEWATLVFSLGNSFLTVPLEKVISLDVLMQPLQLRETISIGDVISNLLNESTHPPVYFVLTHLWFKLFSNQDGLVAVGLARSLSVLFGIISIPAIFALSSFISASLVCGQIAAALMAFSPYGVYLSQETRHYTLAILLIMASIACLVIAIRCIQQRNRITSKVMFLWIVINSVGVATHYFFVLALVTEILVLLSWFIKDIKSQVFSLQSSSPWRNISLAIMGTFAGCSIWVWTWLNIPDNQLTDWTKHGNPWSSEFLEPIGRTIGWITTMILLLPIEGIPIWLTVVSVIILLSALIYLIVNAVEYLKNTPQYLDNEIILKYFIFATLLTLSFAYLGDRDLTLAARFQFFYFPGAIILVAAILNYCWQQRNSSIVVMVIAIAFCGSLSVVNNYAYQKPDRADIVALVIREAQQKNLDAPVLIATVHKTHEQTGEMMGIAWEWLRKIKVEVIQPQFLLLHKKPDTPEQNITNNFHQQLTQLPRPLDVWVVNFSAPTGLESQNCVADLAYKRRVSGYRYRLFHCR